MKDLIYYNELFLIYADLLTENEINTFKDYYFEDLSLAEIADNKNVSRAAVQKTLKNVLEKLSSYEKSLHIYLTKTKLKEALEISNIEEVKKKIDEVIKL